MDDLKCVFDNAHSHQFLPIVTTVHHQRVSKTFNDRTLCFAKAFHLVSARRMRQVFCMLLFDSYIILQTYATNTEVAIWCSRKALVSINDVNPCCARLVLG